MLGIGTGPCVFSAAAAINANAWAIVKIRSMMVQRASSVFGDVVLLLVVITSKCKIHRTQEDHPLPAYGKGNGLLSRCIILQKKCVEIFGTVTSGRCKDTLLCAFVQIYFSGIK